MKKTIIASVALAVSAAVFGQDRGAITYHYFSEVKDNPAWVKDVITAEGENFDVLKDRQGILAPKQEAVALEVSTENLSKIEQSYKEGFKKGIENLATATNDMPTTGFTFGLVMPLVPSATRTAIEGFVVETAYDAAKNTDIVLVHFTQSMAVEPVLEFPYISDSGLTTNRIKGVFKSTDYPGSHWSNVVTRVLGPDEIEYNNCHTCYVKRPASLQGFNTWFYTNVKWGNPSTGIDYGNILHLAYGQPLFTGVLTNTVNHTYVNIKDGAIQEPGFISYTP